jgi:hypothetical protein
MTRALESLAANASESSSLFVGTSFEQRLEHRDVRVAERDRPQRLVGDVFCVDEVVQLVWNDDAHADG